MLKCKDVAHLASEYLDNNTPKKITLQIHLHLLLCANCRRFMKHLRITAVVTAGIASNKEAVQSDDTFDAEEVLKRIKAKIDH